MFPFMDVIVLCHKNGQTMCLLYVVGYVSSNIEFSNVKQYTYDLLAPLVATSISFAEVARQMGIPPNGGSVTYLSKRIKALNIDTTHFWGARACHHPKHANFHNRTLPEQILVMRDMTQGREKSYRLTRALLEIGREYICALCAQTSEWNHKPLTLQVDHIDGNALNNLRENLRFLCPNCHTQTDTHSIGCTRKRKIGTTSLKAVRQHIEREKPHCAICANTLSHGAQHCRSCAAKVRESKITRIQPTKIVWPSHEELQQMVDSSSYSATGRSLGVSDNAVRKRLHRHNTHT